MEYESQDVELWLPEGLDYDAQFDAIRRLLYRQERSDQELVDNIEQVERVAEQTRGAASQLAVDQWVDLVHGSCYQDAAHSMAAVGMIAPFIESVFRQVFQRLDSKLPQHHLVWCN